MEYFIETQLLSCFYKNRQTQNLKTGLLLLFLYLWVAIIFVGAGSGVVDARPQPPLELPGFFIQGDIFIRLVPKDDRNVNYSNGSIPPPNAGIQNKRWPNAQIPYKIHNWFSPAQRNMIEQAMATLSRQTCVQFQKWRGEPGFLEIISHNYGNGSACWSEPGYQGWRRQQLNLDPEGCMSPRTILHELIHTIGFHHEQSRSDRDEYVTINETNVRQGVNLLNFEKFRPSDVTDFHLPYDYGSIMHYALNEFSAYPSLQTIVPKPEKFKSWSIPPHQIGRRAELSGIDVDKIKKMYDFPMWCQCGQTDWWCQIYKSNPEYEQAHGDERSVILFSSSISVVDRSRINWLTSLYFKGWTYIVATYGPFGTTPQNGRLYGEFRADKREGGYGWSTDTWAEKGGRNVIGMNISPNSFAVGDMYDKVKGGHIPLQRLFWDLQLDLLSQIVSHGNNKIYGCPAKNIWGSEGFRDIFVYDLLRGMGMRGGTEYGLEAEPWKNWKLKFATKSEIAKNGQIYWLKDYWLPILKESGKNGSEVFTKFFALTAAHWPKQISAGQQRQQERRWKYVGQMNLGEYTHFLSGAVGKSVRDFSAKVFKWDNQVEAQFLRAKQMYPGIQYNCVLAPFGFFDSLFAALIQEIILI